MQHLPPCAGRCIVAIDKMPRGTLGTTGDHHMSEETVPSPLLVRVVKQLKSDIAVLRDAYQWAVEATRVVLKKYEQKHLVHTVSLDHAAWAWCKFVHDQEKYNTFLDDAAQSHKGNGNVLFGWQDPASEDHCAEADRLLDRIDLALHFIKEHLHMSLPGELRGEGTGSYSIRNGGWNQKELLERVTAFAEASNDLFSVLSAARAQRSADVSLFCASSSWRIIDR